jgi:signal transduction histidine kinase
VSLVTADELWIRLAWFARLRWGLPPVLLLLGVAVNAWAGPLVPMREACLLLGVLWLMNAGYVALLRRWQAEPAAHLHGLRAMAHGQVLADIAVDMIAIYAMGGGRSPVGWLASLPVLAAALLFGNARAVVFYGAWSVGLFAVVSLLTGGIEASLLLFAVLVSSIGYIAVYFSRRIEELLALREESRRKDQVLSIVSHELGNPLAALRASVYLARERSAPSHDQGMQRSLERIDAQVERMTRLVGDLYDLAAVQSGQLRLEPSTFDLMKLLREISDSFHGLHPRLHLSVDGPESAWGRWDRQRIDQLVTNLLGNAAKYAGESADVRVQVERADGALVLSITDNGPGIAPEQLSAIFEPFQRFDERRRATGLGLGLALARQIALLHGGRLWAESRVGAGSTFHVRLPTGDAAAPS